MHPTRPGLADAMRIPNVSKRPIGAKFDVRKALRRAIAPENEHGLVSIIGPNGLLYANTFGNSGAIFVGSLNLFMWSEIQFLALRLIGTQLYTLSPLLSPSMRET